MSSKDPAQTSCISNAQISNAQMDLSSLNAINAIAFIKNNKILNENGTLIEFKDHKFLIEPYLDRSERQVAIKCLHPNTKILTSDFQWVSIKNIKIGQRIFSVDEASSKYNYRKLRIGIVENKFIQNKKAFRLTFDDGRIIIAGLKHKFLCKRRGSVDTQWRSVENIRINDSIRSIVKPWTNTSSYEDGWFGGFIDGEGTIRRRKCGGIEMSLSQVKGDVLERAKNYLSSNGYYYKENLKVKTDIGKKNVYALRVSSSVDIMKIIGLTKPSRFINKQSLWDGAIPPKGNSYSKVVKIEKVSNQEMIDIQTSTGTFLAEGFITHNCSQIGWSTLAILRSFHLAKYARANIIHSFPSRNMSKEFVVPKVDPLINRNPVIKEMIKTDTSSLKEIDGRFIYYRGSYDVSEAISISAHIFIADEYDRSNQKILKTYRSRLDDAKRERPELGWEWQFSNPSIPGTGVDLWWQKSDQKHWFVKCRHCGYDWYLKFPENINMDTKTRICAKCHNILEKRDLTGGRWVKKYVNRPISGYWVSQMFVPWISAEKIIDDSEGDQDIFHNFTLGLPFLSKDTTISRQAIIQCLSPGFNPKTAVAMGVDNGVEKHYVVGNRHGIFEMGVTRDWEDIVRIRNRYGATMVIDALPYPNTPSQLAQKYPGKVFIHYFQADKKNLGIIRWDGRVVKSDRTKIIDAVVAEINARDVTFNMTQSEMEDYIKHWEQVFRVVEKTPMGTMKPKWVTIENRDDHYVFAHVLWRMAMEKTMGFGGIVRSPRPGPREEEHPVVQNQTVGALDLREAIKRANKK